MRQHLSLFLTASFLFLSQGVQASSIDDDNSSVLQGSGVVQVASTASSAMSSTSDDLQCYRKINGQLEPMFDDGGKLLDLRAQERGSDDIMSFVAEDGKLLWTNVLSGLAHQVRVEIMEWLQDNPRGQLSLMHVSHGFRRLPLVLPQRSNDAVSTGNALKKRLFTVLIGGQTGDLDLFIQDNHFNAIQILSLPDLQDAFAFRHYAETLSPKTEHGKTYRSIGPGDIKIDSWMPILRLDRKNLRLVPLNFPEVSRIQTLDLHYNKLKAPPVVTGLRNLWCLNLSNNQITAAPVLTGLKNLQILNLSNNQITAAHVVTGLTNLQILYLNNNQITAAPVVTGLTKLEILDLSENQITAAPVVTGLKRLMRLVVSNNKLSAAPDVTGLKNLQILYLNNNQITAAPDVTGLTKLNALHLDSNLCGNQILLKTLRGLNRGRNNDSKFRFYSLSKDAQGNKVATEIPLD